MNRELETAIEESREFVVSLRRQIHRHPELGNELPRTRQAVLDAIADLDLEIHLSKVTSGIVAVLKGGKPGPTILLRGDMDALPMPEDTGLAFASEVANRMHACGHDAHTAMIAGTARVLCAQRDEVPGTVVFMFQPGEEGPGGAGPMIEEGLLQIAGRPDNAYALHVYPNMPSGKVYCRPGPILAAADTAAIEITGQGGHGSMPWDAVDPIPVVCELAQAMQVYVTRRFNPFDPVVVTVGKISAGTASNVIPEKAYMEVTVRSFSEANRNRIHDGIRALVANISAAHGLSGRVEFSMGYPPTINDAAAYQRVNAVVTETLGAERMVEMWCPLPGAEDFSLVLQEFPGCFIFLGAAPPGTPGEPCHSNRMILDEDAMAVGVRVLVALVMS